jgi:hypothetical protein
MGAPLGSLALVGLHAEVPDGIGREMDGTTGSNDFGGGEDSSRAATRSLTLDKP